MIPFDPADIWSWTDAGGSIIAGPPLGLLSADETRSYLPGSTLALAAIDGELSLPAVAGAITGSTIGGSIT